MAKKMYKIKNTKTGLYKRKGSCPGWTKDGSFYSRKMTRKIFERTSYAWIDSSDVVIVEYSIEPTGKVFEME